MVLLLLMKLVAVLVVDASDAALDYYVVPDLSSLPHTDRYDAAVFTYISSLMHAHTTDAVTCCCFYLL